MSFRCGGERAILTGTRVGPPAAPAAGRPADACPPWTVYGVSGSPPSSPTTWAGLAPRWLPGGGRVLRHLRLFDHGAPARRAGPGDLTGGGVASLPARARRLLPALVVLVLLLSLVASAAARDAVPDLRADIPAALAFVANWQQLFHHDSYFESMGRPPLLLHLWSLGVEEQFYLVWPLVVLLVLRLSRRPARALARVAPSSGRPLPPCSWPPFSCPVTTPHRCTTTPSLIARA